jgi:hypothetical protein
MTLKDLSIKAQIEIKLEVLEEELSMIKDIVEDKNVTDWEKDFYENVKIHLETLIDLYKKRLEIWTKED